MKPVWQAVAWTGGVLGAAATGAVVGVASSRKARRKSAETEDPYAEEALGELVANRRCTVATDDGIPLWTWEFGPSDGGKADATVVFVHGFALDSRGWHFQVRELVHKVDPRLRLVAYDHRGHGRSGYSHRNTSTIEQLASDLDAVLRATVPDGPIVLVGHSMGGMVVMALAELRPELFTDQVRAVAFLGTSAGDLRESALSRPWLSRYNPVPRGVAMLAALQPELVERARHLGDSAARNVIRLFAFGDRNTPASLVDLLADMISSTRVEVLTDFLPTFAAHNRARALAALSTCAVLVLSGDADRITPFRHAETIAEALPHGTLVRAEGAGHPVMLERHELVNGELTALLERSFRGSGRPRRARRRDTRQEPS